MTRVAGPAAVLPLSQRECRLERVAAMDGAEKSLTPVTMDSNEWESAGMSGGSGHRGRGNAYRKHHGGGYSAQPTSALVRTERVTGLA